MVSVLYETEYLLLRANETLEGNEQCESHYCNIVLFLTCNVNFTLMRGETMMLRVLEREVLPRSLYDFTYISGTSDGTTSEVVEVSNFSFKSDFWMVIHTEYLFFSTIPQVTATSTTSSRWRLIGVGTSSFQLVAEQYERLDSNSASALLTDQSFSHATFSWIIGSSAGVAVFTFALILLVMVLCFFAFRVARAPEIKIKYLVVSIHLTVENLIYLPPAAKLPADSIRLKACKDIHDFSTGAEEKAECKRPD
ncbi:Hypothetical protein PHPALM_6205 [Phytophthora palmivora]|uniref:Uncharacterized protein n=1 Tax=Phytophthora palmivora TaxID=4796 RepID=A0A2P4YFD9_9STRA|nr:Hypothetical protein PHPALM_6205 [Phytophthora palmivora]